MKLILPPRRLAFAAACLSVFAPAAWADHSPVHLEKIHMQGKRDARTQTSTEEAKAEVARTAGGATVIDAADLRDQRAATITDALSQAAGVFAQSRFGSQEMRLSIRGSGLQRTFHTRGISVLQDGVPLNLADGGGDFQSIDTLSADHIEVYRGANALQYGAANLGGSINFVAPTGLDARDELRVEGGSFGYQRLYGQTGVVSGKTDVFASVGVYAQDGFRAHAQQREARLIANVGQKLANGIETRTFLAVSRSDSELPGSLTKAQLQQDSSQANSNNVSARGDQRRDTEVLRLSNKTIARVSDDTVTEIAVYLSRKDLDHPIFQVLLQENYDYGIALRAINSTPLWGHDNRLTLGINPQYGITRGDSYINLPNTTARGARTDRYRQTASNLIAYAENQTQLIPQWMLSVGGQAVVAQRNNQDQFIAAGTADSSYDRSYLGFSPKIGLLYTPISQLQFYSNVSGSFEPPSFGEGPQTAIAPRPLNAQRAMTYELGSRGDWGIMEWDISAYHARIRDELLSIQAPVGGNQTTGVTVNADKTIHQGLEMAFTARPWHWLSMRVSGLYNDFTLDGDKNFGDNNLPGIPKYVVRSELKAKYHDQFMALTSDSAAKTFIDYAQSFSADRYTIFGIKAGGGLTQSWSWFADARNLANKKYAASTGVIRNANGADSAQFLPGDGISFYAGLQWNP